MRSALGNTSRLQDGCITKAGSSQARWLLTQSCQHVARRPGPLGAFFPRLAKRKNRQVAIVAVARKLITIAFLMLKNNEPYRYAKPMWVAQKFAALDRAAGGKTPRSGKRQAGPTAQARAGLAAVYAGAGLPKVASPEELPKGEQRMLEQRKLTSFVGDLYELASRPSATQPEAAEPMGRPAGRPRCPFFYVSADADNPGAAAGAMPQTPGFAEG
ncbi:hypothetical protein Pla175_24410 [Pirellulimonas nuda]|uniref:Transposase IS116/IS110/IS902 family protein n=1 Tax=Pirellulimonas nuda TaxID=2528009 RepID=A0A518DC53_9BACT|nr:hypothetical protein [Pirellulimonas nuda]QDU89055.1 hypothetical protein Pla175_24410 [Pirellulimonas nuda]